MRADKDVRGVYPTLDYSKIRRYRTSCHSSQQAKIEISYFSSISLKSLCQWKAGSRRNWGLILCLTLQCRHNEHDGVSNHQPNHFLVIHLFRCRSKKTSKLRVTGLCEENSPVAGEFPAQRASNAENVSIWWRHHEGALSGDICNARGPWNNNVEFMKNSYRLKTMLSLSVSIGRHGHLNIILSKYKGRPARSMNRIVNLK